MNDKSILLMLNDEGVADVYDDTWDVTIHCESKEEQAETIKILEKHNAKKPDYIADGYADGFLVYDNAKCPICGHDFEYDINDWGCNYCPDCGQKLDWTVEDA